MRQKLTRYERDNETGLNFAQARYHSSNLGRFTSPDPFGGSMRAADPQSFNRYAYVRNNPVIRTDPTGLFDATDEVRSTRWAMSQSFGMEGERRNTNEFDGYADPRPLPEPQAAIAETATAEVIAPVLEAGPQSPGTILIIVGDPGTIGPSGINHSVGSNFDRVAATKEAELKALGYTVIVRRASSFEDFKNALTNNGVLDGVEYLGHSSNIMLYVGERAVPGSNVDHSNIPQLSNANLSAHAYIKLNGCNIGAGGHSSIGQWLSNRLNRTVIGFDGPSRFYGKPDARRGSGGRFPPSTGPLYLLEEAGTKMVVITPW